MSYSMTLGPLPKPLQSDELEAALSGHAEPGHGQRPEWSPETMSLHVSIQRRI